MKTILTSAGAVAALLALTACQPRAPESETRDRAQATQRTPEAVRPSAVAANGAPDRQTGRESQLIEPSSDLGGVLPLKHGFFVSGGSTCEDPPNAALLRYDGVGLNGAHSRDCQIKVLSAKDRTYRIEQTCTEAGEGPAPRTAAQSTVSIENNLEFRIERGSEVETFQYCPASRLPLGIGAGA